MAKLLKPDGDVEIVQPRNGQFFTLKECYNILGCSTVERLELSVKHSLIFDEEGKFNERTTINAPATALAHGIIPVPGDESQQNQWRIADSDFIAGNVLLVEEFKVNEGTEEEDIKWR